MFRYMDELVSRRQASRRVAATLFASLLACGLVACGQDSTAPSLSAETTTGQQLAYVPLATLRDFEVAQPMTVPNGNGKIQPPSTDQSVLSDTTMVLPQSQRRRQARLIAHLGRRSLSPTQDTSASTVVKRHS